MKSLSPEKTVLLLTIAAAGTALALGGVPLLREVLLCSLLATVLSLAVAVIPIVAFALLLRVIRTPLDAVPEIRLVVRREPGEVRWGAVGGPSLRDMDV
jgi:hypothetical protein